MYLIYPYPRLGDVTGCCTRPSCCDGGVDGQGVICRADCSLPSFCPTPEPKPEPRICPKDCCPFCKDLSCIYPPCDPRIIEPPKCPSCCKFGCKHGHCALPHCRHLLPTPKPIICPKCCKFGCEISACALPQCNKSKPPIIVDPVTPKPSPTINPVCSETPGVVGPCRAAMRR